jgi:cyanophycin synthetase
MRFSTSLTLLSAPRPHEGLPKIRKILLRLAWFVLRATVKLLRLAGIARLTSDGSAIDSGRTRVLWEEAMRRGYEPRLYSLFGKPTEACEVRVKGQRVLFSGLPRPVYTESGSDQWLDDKAVLKDVLRDAGVPVPRGGRFSRFEDMEAMFEALEKPVVVKPRLGSRGRHTTTHIHSIEELRSAFERARQLCREVVMEEHLVGSVYRGTVIDGRVVGVLRGDPPRVVGDGVHTIEELVSIKNRGKHPKVADVVLGDAHRDFLARTGRDVATILDKGEAVDLLGNIGVRCGGFAAEEMPRTHTEIIRTLEEAARVVDDPIIGFDFIIADIARDPREQKWGIIEANSLPFIDLHHYPLEGEPVNVAAHLWDYVEKEAERF